MKFRSEGLEVMCAVDATVESFKVLKNGEGRVVLAIEPEDMHKCGSLLVLTQAPALLQVVVKKD